MGDKDAARRLMKANHVPTTPGTDILQDADQAQAAAEEIGYPVLIKASAGGGGKGIRLVERPEDMERAFETASAEAEKAFGDGRMYMEKYLDPVKHIEVQLLADEAGTSCAWGSGSALSRRTTKSSSRSRPPRRWTRRPEKADGHRHPGRPGRGVRERGDRGVLDGQGPQLLLYGDEHPAAGGAPGE